MHESRIPPSPAPALAFDDVRSFLEVARQGSVAAAARTLAVDHATVARRVTALETRLGMRLFDRMPRSWSLTSECQGLLEPAQRLEDESLAFGRAAAAVSRHDGAVRVSLPPLLASHVVVPALAARAEGWPGIDLELVGEVRMADLNRREADIAIRFERPEAPGLATRPLGQVAYRAYATPALLERPAASWTFIGLTPPLTGLPQQRLLARTAGDRRFVMRANDLASTHQACRGGLGIAMLPVFLAGRDETLREVPMADTPVQRPLWLVVHPDVRRAARVRRVADLLVALFEGEGAALG